MRFLDVACGSGALAIPAARIGAEVVAIDQSPVMLKLLGERASNEVLRIETRVMDGHALTFENGSFDMVGSQFGVMLFSDMPKGIREMARVERPGARVLVIAYGDPHQINFLGYLVQAIQSVRPEFDGPPMDPRPLPFQLSEPERVRQELTGAGLKAAKVETITESTTLLSLRLRPKPPVPQLKNVVEAVENLFVVGDGENRCLLLRRDFAQQVHHDSRPL